MTKKGFIKTAEEIEIMREGGRRLASILSQLRDFIKPGITTVIGTVTIVCENVWR